MRDEILVPLCIFAYAVLAALPIALFIVFGPWTVGVRLSMAPAAMFAIGYWLADRTIKHIESEPPQ